MSTSSAIAGAADSRPALEDTFLANRSCWDGLNCAFYSLNTNGISDSFHVSSFLAEPVAKTPATTSLGEE
jgi:hypothetical protein